MSDKILVFIPCYNCAPQIGRVAKMRVALADFSLWPIVKQDYSMSEKTKALFESTQAEQLKNKWDQPK